MSLNNPAGRLHALLSEAGTPPRENDRETARQKWAKTLAVEVKDSPTLLARLGEVMALPVEVRGAVKSLPEVDHDTYLGPLSNVEKSFGKLNLDALWSQCAREIDGTTMYSLKVCDELLSRQRPERTLPEDEREQLHEEVRNLRKDVQAKEKDKDLREFLLHHLKAMDDALQEYKISGTPPVEEAAKAILGGALIQKQKHRKNPFLRRLFATALSALYLTGGLEGGFALTERVLDALPTGNSVEVQESPDSEDETDGETEDGDSQDGEREEEEEDKSEDED